VKDILTWHIKEIFYLYLDEGDIDKNVRLDLNLISDLELQLEIGMEVVTLIAHYINAYGLNVLHLSCSTYLLSFTELFSMLYIIILSNYLFSVS